MAKEAVSVGGVYLDTAMLDKITAEMEPKASKVVQAYGIAIAGEAAKNAPVDTSALRNSILSESHMLDSMAFRIQDGVEYGLRIELGFNGEDSLGRTYHQAARPFLTPAIEKMKAQFYKAFSGLFK